MNLENRIRRFALGKHELALAKVEANQPGTDLRIEKSCVGIDSALLVRLRGLKHGTPSFCQHLRTENSVGRCVCRVMQYNMPAPPAIQKAFEVILKLFQRTISYDT